MQSPPFPRYLVPPRSKYSPQHHILKHPQLPFLPQCQRPSFTPIQNNRQNNVIEIENSNMSIKGVRNNFLSSWANLLASAVLPLNLQIPHIQIYLLTCLHSPELLGRFSGMNRRILQVTKVPMERKKPCKCRKRNERIQHGKKKYGWASWPSFVSGKVKHFVAEDKAISSTQSVCRRVFGLGI